jgi:hypothetical protein
MAVVRRKVFARRRPTLGRSTRRPPLHAEFGLLAIRTDAAVIEIDLDEAAWA